MAINLISEYVPLLDEVFQQGSKTMDLMGNSALIREGNNANEILLPKISTEGLADYGKSTGFVSGTSSLTWETHTFTQDRGREFNVDKADNLETAGVAFGALASDFTRVNVVPEADAYRFASMFANAGTTKEADLDNTTTIAAIDEAIETMNDANVPEEGRILYVSNEIYKYLKQEAGTRFLSPAQDPNRNFETFDEMKIVKVPRSRFYSEITLNDGTTGGQEAGGYEKTDTTGRDLNFMIVYPAAVVPYVKFNDVRTFSPNGEEGLPVNQDADAWKFQERIYHDLWVLENKVDGIYAHNKTT